MKHVDCSVYRSHGSVSGGTHVVPPKATPKLESKASATVPHCADICSTFKDQKWLALANTTLQDTDDLRSTCGLAVTRVKEP